MTVCSGIGAPEHAAPWIDWRYQSEIEAFPAAVLKHRFPDAVNLGDMTKFKEWPDATVDVLCGGTPCQSFSVAGLRQGLADPRGNLMLTYLAIAARYRPRWMVWENVPGVLSSNEGRDFGSFLGGLGKLGYGFAYRVLDVQFGRTLRFPFAIPQRRRRVFVVGYLGDWRRAAAVLFDAESLSGHPAPRRDAGQNAAPTISARPTGGGGLGTDFDLDGGLVVSTLRGEGFDASEDGTGRQNLVPVANSGDVSYCLTASAQNSLDAETETLVAFDCKGTQVQFSEAGEAPTMRSMSHANSNQNAGGHLAVAFDMRGREGGAQFEGPHETDNIRATDGGSSRSYIAQPYSIMPMNSGKDYKARETSVAQPLMAGGPVGGNQGGDFLVHPWAVRRLMPSECEKLMGFPVGWTAIPWRGKPADLCPDGHRYKALGNSWGVNCGEYIFERIRLIEGM